ncbi:HTH domain-containing protein [Cohnella fermenti]|uniref:HTH domain-containing protein n=1 Tax=Cohnella fermenti TaxID=2565925 RepID=A0A4S4C225_9BACL|nr:HTH domain-containing protein [Cohnella fermenti]
MKLGQLVAIIYKLISHRVFSAARLTEKFQVSPRTIYRAIDAICAASFQPWQRLDHTPTIRPRFDDDGFMFCMARHHIFTSISRSGVRCKPILQGPCTLFISSIVSS